MFDSLYMINSVENIKENMLFKQSTVILLQLFLTLCPQKSKGTKTVSHYCLLLISHINITELEMDLCMLTKRGTYTKIGEIIHFSFGGAGVQHCYPAFILTDGLLVFQFRRKSPVVYFSQPKLCDVKCR